MKKLLLRFLFICFQISCVAQQQQCGVSEENFQKEIERRQLLTQIKNKLNYTKKTNTLTYIPIKMHLFGLNDNTGYADAAAVNGTLAELNKQFKPANIEFYFSGTNFKYYPNSTFYLANQTSTDETNFHNTFAVNNAINFYVAYTVKNPAPTGLVVGGWSYITPSAQLYNRMWVNNIQLNDKKSTPHEVGHYFGLLHTFNNSTNATISERELVTRNFNETVPRLSANCLNKGDYLCDTPADPRGLGDASVQNCQYTGMIADANSDQFNPSVSNIMDYNFCNPYNFTTNQYARMEDGLLLVTNANDFSLNAPETIQSPPSNLYALSSGDYSGSLELHWNDNSSVETGYIIEKSSSPNGPFIAFAGVEANTTMLSNIVSETNTLQYFRVKASNTKNNYSNTSAGIIDSNLCGNNSGQSCDLNADPALAAWQIEGFSLTKNNNTLIENITSGCSINGIGNYFNTYAATISPGDNLDFWVASKYGTNGAYTVAIKLYADWNQDQVFDEIGEQLYSGENIWFSTSGNFTVPNNLPAGTIRLRVVLSAGLNFVPSACATIFGEIEDYKLISTTLNSNSFNNSNNSLTISPNPTSSLLQINSELPLDKITITDLTGKKVLETNSKIINVESLAKGMYIVKAVSSEGKWVSKFVKD